MQERTRPYDTDYEFSNPEAEMKGKTVSEPQDVDRMPNESKPPWVDILIILGCLLALAGSVAAFINIPVLERRVERLEYRMQFVERDVLQPK